jgi:hypothetical protein
MTSLKCPVRQSQTNGFPSVLALFPLFPKEPEKTTGELWTKSPFNWPKHWTSAQASRIAISSSDHHGAVAIVFDLPRAAGVLWIASENYGDKCVISPTNSDFTIYPMNHLNSEYH